MSAKKLCEPQEPWKIRALELSDQKTKLSAIVEMVREEYFSESDDVYNRVRKTIQRYRPPKRLAKRENNENFVAGTKTTNEKEPQMVEKYEHREDGTYISERLIEIIEARSKDDRYILEAHGFDPDKWDILSCRNNIWRTTTEDGKVNCQSKITAKPKVGAEALFDIEEYFKRKDFNIAKPETTPMQYDEGGEYLEVCLPDLHGGLFSWRNETGEDYDLHIAKERFEVAMEDVKNRCVGKKFCGIIFVTLGDLLNFDNEEQSTTKRTPQQSDGRTAKVHDLVLDMLIDAITMLGNIAPVEVIYLPGNHDLVTGRMLMVAVKMAFRNDKNILFDVSPNPLKARRFGNVMVGWTHGDMPERNMGSWLPQMARKDFGECSVVEVHAGHFHKQSTKEKAVVIKNSNQTFEDGGVVIRYLPTISSASGWAHQQGYSKTVKTIMSFLWNEQSGLRDIWFSGVG